MILVAHYYNQKEGLQAPSCPVGPLCASSYQEPYKQDSHPANMEAFRSFLEKKVTEIQSRTGCSPVQFRVIDSEGKPSLEAKPRLDSRDLHDVALPSYNARSAEEIRRDHSFRKQ